MPDRLEQTIYLVGIPLLGALVACLLFVAGLTLRAFFRLVNLGKEHVRLEKQVLLELNDMNRRLDYYLSDDVGDAPTNQAAGIQSAPRQAGEPAPRQP